MSVDAVDHGHSDDELLADEGRSQFQSKLSQFTAQDLVLCFGAWLLGCVVLFLLFKSPLNNGILNHPDSAWKLIQVRDYLAGQSWYDLTQYRLINGQSDINGLGRIFDLPLIFVFYLAQLLFGNLAAPTIVLTLYPIIIYSFCIAFAMVIGYSLAGKKAALLTVPVMVLTYPVLQSFQAGRMDSSLVDFLLILALTAACMMIRKTRFSGLLIGAASSLLFFANSPLFFFTLVGLSALLMLWVISEDDLKQIMIQTGLTIFGFICSYTILLLSGPDAVTASACGLNSLPVYILVGATGLAICSLGGLSPVLQLRKSRFLALILVFGLISLFAYFLASECSLDIGAHVPLGTFLSGSESFLIRYQLWPLLTLIFYIFPVLVWGLTLVRLMTGGLENSVAFLTGFVFLTVAIFFTVLDTTRLTLAFLISVPLAIGFAFQLVQQVLMQGQFGRNIVRIACVAVLTVAWATSPLLSFFDVTPARAYASLEHEFPEQCRQSRAFANIQDLPLGVILTQKELAPFILVYSPHSVLKFSSPSLEDKRASAYKSFLAKPDEALKSLTLAGVDYIAVCQESKEMKELVASAPDGLFAHIDQSRLPKWIVEHQSVASDTLKLYKIWRY